MNPKYWKITHFISNEEKDGGGGAQSITFLTNLVDFFNHKKFKIDLLSIFVRTSKHIIAAGNGRERFTI